MKKIRWGTEWNFCSLMTPSWGSRSGEVSVSVVQEDPQPPFSLYPTHVKGRRKPKVVLCVSDWLHPEQLDFIPRVSPLPFFFLHCINRNIDFCFHQKKKKKNDVILRKEVRKLLEKARGCQEEGWREGCPDTWGLARKLLCVPWLNRVPFSRPLCWLFKRLRDFCHFQCSEGELVSCSPFFTRGGREGPDVVTWHPKGFFFRFRI